MDLGVFGVFDCTYLFRSRHAAPRHFTRSSTVCSEVVVHVAMALVRVPLTLRGPTRLPDLPLLSDPSQVKRHGDTGTDVDFELRGGGGCSIRTATVIVHVLF